MLSSPGRNPRFFGATDPDAVRRILDLAYRNAADRKSGRRRLDPEAVNPSDLLPDDLAADPAATAAAIEVVRALGYFSN